MLDRIDSPASRTSRVGWHGLARGRSDAACTTRLQASFIAVVLTAAALLHPSLARAAPPAKPAAPGASVGMQVGVIVPQSWPDKAQGDEIVNGMMLALKTWPGQPPTLVVKDSACDAKKAAAAAQALIAAKVDVLVSGFCVLGTVPALARDAGLPFVSANAERLATVPDTTVQLGQVPIGIADRIAARLRADTSLRVTADSACWIDFAPKVPDRVDAALCPALHVDAARWIEIAPSYAAAYRQPFGTAAARGYAAMQVALSAIRQLRAGSKPANAFKDAREIDTLLGKVRAHDDAAAPEDAMQLVLGARLPRLSPRDAKAFEEMTRAKGCGCAKGSSCPSGTPWSGMPFVVACCGKEHSCGSGAAMAAAH